MDSSAAPPRGDGEEVSRWGRRVWFPLLPYTVWRAEWGGIFSPPPSGITASRSERKIFIGRPNLFAINFSKILNFSKTFDLYRKK